MDKNELKINNLNISDVTKAKPSELKIDTKVEDTSKDTKEPNKEETVKHVVSYIGRGRFTDSTGFIWTNGTQITYSDDEYAMRDDLKFMVGYGEMQHTEVSV